MKYLYSLLLALSLSGQGVVVIPGGIGTIPGSTNGGGGTSVNGLLKGNGSAIVAATAADVSRVQYVAGGGTAQAQTATLSPAITAQAAGQFVCWLPAANNTGAGPTIAINGLTAKTITKYGTTALVADDITTTAVACAIYDGTRYQLQNPQTATGGTTYTFAAGDSMAVSTVGSTVTYLVDAAVVPRYFTGAGVPGIACTQGRDFYLNTSTSAFYQCTATNTWATVGGSSLINRSAITGDICSNAGATTTLYDFAANQLAAGDTVEISVVGRVAGTVGTPLMRIVIEGTTVTPNVSFGSDPWAYGTSRTYVVGTTTANTLGMAQRANGGAPSFDSDVAQAIDTTSSTGFTIGVYNESCTGGGTMTAEYTIKQVRNAP